MTRPFLATAVLIVMSLAACSVGPDSPRGFSLPAGDIERGRAAFIQLECNTCHTISDIEQLDRGLEEDISVALGGEVTQIKTYGELVTSIINPSHRLARGYRVDDIQDEAGESRMRNYNDVMRVSELIDLVAFLESNYSLRPYDPTIYPSMPM